MAGGMKMRGGVLVGGIVAAADVAAGAADPQMQPRLPIFRHSSQPSALGVTSWMPAICVQPLDGIASHLGGFGEMQTARRWRISAVSRGGLPSGLAKAGTDRGHAVKGTYCDQIQRRRPAGGRDRSLC